MTDLHALLLRWLGDCAAIPHARTSYALTLSYLHRREAIGESSIFAPHNRRIIRALTDLRRQGLARYVRRGAPSDQFWVLIWECTEAGRQAIQSPPWIQQL